MKKTIEIYNGASVAEVLKILQEENLNPENVFIEVETGDEYDLYGNLYTTLYVCLNSRE